MHLSRFLPKSAQFHVFASFFLYAVVLGGIYTRLGDMQLSMNILPGALGAALIGTALGTQITLMFAGKILKYMSHRQGLLVLIPVLAAFETLASISPTPLILFLILMFSGFSIGMLEVIINLEADRVEHKSGKRIMNRAHAFWSFGFFFAGVIGALAKQFGLSPFHHLGLVSIGITLIVLAVFKNFQPAPDRSTQKTSVPLISRPSKAIMILVAFTLSAMLLEGAGFDWSVIYMRDVFGSSPFISTFAFSIGALFQGGVRFFADGVVDKFGPIRIGKTMIVLLGIGALCVTFAPNYLVALLGFALIGAGASTMFPLAMSAAAQREDKPAAINVASLAQLSFMTFLLAPPILGFIGEHFGMRAAFGISLPLVVISWFTIHALTPNAPSTKGKSPPQ